MDHRWMHRINTSRYCSNILRVSVVEFFWSKMQLPVTTGITTPLDAKGVMYLEYRSTVGSTVGTVGTYGTMVPYRRHHSFALAQERAGGRRDSTVEHSTRRHCEPSRRLPTRTRAAARRLHTV